MNEIPEDVMRTAIDIASKFYECNGNEMTVARAILTERKRCAWIAGSYHTEGGDIYAAIMEGTK